MHCQRVSCTIVTGLIAAATILAWSVAAQPCSPVQAAKLLASDGAMGDNYGFSVSISGDTAVIGAWLDDDNGTDSGSAYVYRFDGTAWVQEAKLLASDGAADAQFGRSVSIYGDVAVIGAFRDDDNGIRSGSAYVYRFDGTGWVQEAKLLASDGAEFDRFGISVSVSGDVALVGAAFDTDNGIRSGSAYVFRFDGTGWAQEAKLLATDGAELDFFGYCVSVAGDVVLVGAYGDDDNGPTSGSVYVFGQGGTGWVEEAKLLAADGATGDRFGLSVSVLENTAVVGAPVDDDNGTDSGSAYVYRSNGTAWVQDAKLLASDGAMWDSFGESVSVSGDRAVIGAYRNSDDGFRSGSAYVYRFHGTGWVQDAKLLATDAAEFGRFGISVSVSGDKTVIGAWGDSDNGTDSGSAYVFDLNCDIPCLPDVNGDGVLTAGDFTAWIAAYNAGDPGCDQNGDDVCNPADFTAWIANYNAGCP